jgi:TDG/mug DNA glycosylase family protein
MDRTTVERYERDGLRWVRARHARRSKEAPTTAAFARRVELPGWRADLGCGPGWAAAALAAHGSPVLALDAARSMLLEVPSLAPHAHQVQADLEHLPLRRGALAAAWGYRSYVHVPSRRLPLALADLHHATVVGGRVRLRLMAGDGEGTYPDDDFPGRFFASWSPDRLVDVILGAGFDSVEVGREDEWLDVEAVRIRSLPDTVAPGMRLLCVGLNPSEYAADAGAGFARPGNRFWPAALAAGLVSRDRDPGHAVRVQGIGMTDLVKRATPRADEISDEEYRAGGARVARLVEWLAPAAVCFVGLAGYRAAIDRSAQAGWQDAPFGGRPAYVMPNPSGANAHVQVDDVAAHLRAAAAVSR